jgi:hypothetical protein
MLDHATLAPLSILGHQLESNMKVYSVIQQEPYSSSDLLGVFGSREEAFECIKRQEGYQKKWYHYGIVKSDLGQDIDMLGMIDWVE